MAENDNFQEIGSVEQFQQALSKDLERVALINFWAEWAEPCKAMNEVVRELAKQYPALLVLQVWTIHQFFASSTLTESREIGCSRTIA